MNVRTLYCILLLLPSVVLAQRQMVVVNLESKVPVRDVKISTDGGQELRTSWDGLFALPDSFRRLDFHHPDFERRYVLSSELKGDTIFLIPNVNALREVVIYGERRFDKRMVQMLKPSPQQLERDKLPQVIPAGPNVLAIAAWLYENLYGKKREKRLARKKALNEVRKQEAELQEASRRPNSKSGGIRLKRSDRLSESALLSIAGTSAFVFRARGVEVVL